MNWLPCGLICSAIVCYVLLGISMYRSAIKRKDDDKNKMDGQSLGGYDIPEEDMGFFCGEQPFVDRLERYN
jgi:hypothetical protein